MKGKVIGVMSFKGGVGKTIVTINIASALRKMGKDVLVVDGNFLSPNLHFYLGLLEPQRTLKEIIRENSLPENAIYEHKSGIHLLPCNFYRNVNFQKFKELIENLKEKYDYILIDSGPSYTEEVVAILMSANELIFIATPDYPTLAATVKATKLAKYKNLKIRGIVINRKKKKNFELKKREIEKTTGINVFGEIPEDNKLQKSITKFSPVVWIYKRAKSSKAFLRIAKRIDSSK